MTNHIANAISLRAAVLILDAVLAAGKQRALANIAPDYAIWRRKLVRMLACPSLDNLADVLRGKDLIQARVEAAHEAGSVAGIQRVRRALAVVESYIDTVDLAELDAEPPLDPVLDAPRRGIVAHALGFVTAAGARRPMRVLAPRPRDAATPTRRRARPRRSLAPVMSA